MTKEELLEHIRQTENLLEEYARKQKMIRLQRQVLFSLKFLVLLTIPVSIVHDRLEITVIALFILFGAECITRKVS